MNHRLFSALWPSDELQLAIERATRDLVARSGCKPISRINYHATLVFLGSVADERLALVHAVANETRAPAFCLQLDHVHAWRRSRVLFLGGNDIPAALSDLVATLHRNLREREFMLEERPFRLHVTLARDTRVTERAAIKTFEWRVDEFVLVESTPGRNGSRYDIVGRWPLASSN